MKNKRQRSHAEQASEALPSPKRHAAAQRLESSASRSGNTTEPCKGPSPKDLKELQDIFKSLQVTLLSVEEADAMLGNNSKSLGEGAYGAAYLNAADNVVLKYSHDFDAFMFCAKEAEAMTVLGRVQGVQKLVGVCMERFMMATKYGGPNLYHWLGSKSPLLPLQWIDIAIKITKIFWNIHSLDIIHNDIKSRNLCLDVSPDGIEVTVIDFGMFDRRGKQLCFSGNWSADVCYPPEFFERDGGRCGSRSDIYGIGRLMKKILWRVSPETPGLVAWLEKSQSHTASSREGLDVLLDALREERNIIRRRMMRPRQ